MLKFLIPLFILVVCTNFVSYAQTNACYERLSDASGLNTDSYQTMLSNSACALKDSFPNENQKSQFKVFDCGFYVLHNVTTGYPAELQKKIDQVSAVSPFYLLFAKQNEPQGLYTRIYVAMNLPDTGYFRCMDLISPNYREVIRAKIELVANNILTKNGVGWPAYAQAEMAAMDSLKVIFGNLKSCCLQNRGLNVTACGNCTFTAADFEQMLADQMLARYNVRDFESVSGSISQLPTSDIVSNYIFSLSKLQLIISIQNDTINLDRSAYCAITPYHENSKSAVAYIIDTRTGCFEANEKIMQFVEDQSYAKFLYLILPGVNNTVRVKTSAIVNNVQAEFPSLLTSCLEVKEKAEMVLTDPINFMFATSKDDKTGEFIKTEVLFDETRRNYAISSNKIAKNNYEAEVMPVTGSHLLPSAKFLISPKSLIKGYVVEPKDNPAAPLSTYRIISKWFLWKELEKSSSKIEINDSQIKMSGFLFDLLEDHVVYILRFTGQLVDEHDVEISPVIYQKEVMVEKCAIDPVFIVQYFAEEKLNSYYMNSIETTEELQFKNALQSFSTNYYSINQQKHERVLNNVAHVPLVLNTIA